MSIFLKIFDFINEKYFDEDIINEKSGIKYAEDIIFKLCSSFNITPICAHLFSLYHTDLKIWLCPNQELKLIENEFGLKELKFELRIRYLPYSPKDLNVIVFILNISFCLIEFFNRFNCLKCFDCRTVILLLSIIIFIKYGMIF